MTGNGETGRVKICQDPGPNASRKMDIIATDMKIFSKNTKGEKKARGKGGRGR